MDTCRFAGNADMYGVGIRAGFYMQWYGKILASWIATPEVPGMRLSNSFFVAATFLALCIQTANDNLRPVEIYIILLLTFGGYLYFAPLYVWRLLICCSPRWDPSRYRKDSKLSGKWFSRLNFCLLASVSIFQIYFWVNIDKIHVRVEADASCPRYGFLFARVALRAKGFAAVNIVFHLTVMLACLGVLCIPLARKIGLFRGPKYKEPREIRKMSMQQLDSFIQLMVAGIVNAATELVIEWNGIEEINDVTTAGQTIPMVIGIGLIIRILYVGFYGTEEQDVDSPDAKHSTRHRFSNGGRHAATVHVPISPASMTHFLRLVRTTSTSRRPGSPPPPPPPEPV